MCLAVPGKIIEIKEDKAVIDYDIEKRNVMLLDEGYNVGDYVIVQGGFVVDKVEEKEAKNALELYKNALNSD